MRSVETGSERKTTFLRGQITDLSVSTCFCCRTFLQVCSEKSEQDCSRLQPCSSCSVSKNRVTVTFVSGCCSCYSYQLQQCVVMFLNVCVFFWKNMHVPFCKNTYALHTWELLVCVCVCVFLALWTAGQECSCSQREVNCDGVCAFSQQSAQSEAD